MRTVNKTIELKLKLNPSQRQLIDGWMDDLRAIWNFGLELLIEHRLNAYYDELEKRYDESDRLTPETHQYRKISGVISITVIPRRSLLQKEIKRDRDYA